MILYSTLIALAAAAGAPAGAGKQVQVEGRSFNVEQKGGKAFVTPFFGILRGYSMDAHGVKLARRAAEKATGCLAADSRPLPGAVMVKLNCPAGAPAAR